MDKKMKLQVAKHIWTDFSRITVRIMAVVMVVATIVGFVCGSIKLAGVISNNYLYLLIVDGVIAVFVTVLFRNDLYASKEKLWRSIIHPIINIPMLLGLTMLCQFIVNIAMSILNDWELYYEVANEGRGCSLMITLVVMFFVKISWYLELDPVEHFFEYLDGVIQKVELDNQKKQEGRNSFVVDELNRVLPTNTEPLKKEAQQHKTVTIEQSLDNLKGRSTND